MPTPSRPRSLADLLIAFGPCFTQPTMRTFQALVGGFLAWPGQRTVTGMLAGAGLAGRRHHDLGYRVFSTARWSADQLGLVLLDLITAMLVPAGAPVVLAVDDTLWRRSGPKLHGAAWHHDGNGPGRHRPAWGHRWVVVGVIVHLPFLHRAVCLPVLARLWIPGDPDHTPLQLARELLDLVVAHVGDRPVHLVGDAAYIGKPLQGLPTQVTVTARLRSDAALHQLPPPPTGRPGRAQPSGRLPRRLPAGPGHHRPYRHPSPDHRTLRRPLAGGDGLSATGKSAGAGPRVRWAARSGSRPRRRSRPPGR